jgi:LmbE family N-acetylglucosaminyl deacetylase
VTAVLLAPHNDDETLFASYLILRYRPKVIVCLRSERMHQRMYPGGPLEVDYVGRERETGKALYELRGSGLLGESGFVQWDFPDDNVDEAALRLSIQHEVDESEHVIAPAWEKGGNEQHNLIAEIVTSCQPRSASVPPQQRTRYLTYTWAGRSRSENEVEFEPDWPGRKLRALACYGSQIAHPATAAHFLDGGLREYVA